MMQKIIKNSETSNKLIEILADYKKLMPRCWKMLEQAYLNKGNNVDWPDWCFVPLSVFVDIIYEHQMEGFHEAVFFASLGTWRYSQDIIRFDDDVYNQLIKTGSPNNFPSSALFKLPAWSIFIETPNHDTWVGFTVFLNQDIHDQRPVLFINTLNEDSTLSTYLLYIDFENLNDAINDTISRSIESWNELGNSLDKHMKADELRDCLDIFLPLTLYICSDTYRDSEPHNYPSYPTTNNTKKGPRLFPAKKITYQIVGSEFGKKIRSFNKDISVYSQGSKKKPHIRRAHWHGYWKGKRASDEQTYIYHWLPPVFVGDDT